MYGLIYCAENLHNHKKYIGQTTKTLAKRIRTHVGECAKKNRNIYFHNALRKYGVTGFMWSIICYCESQDSLNAAEAHWIRYLDTIHLGYNRKEGGLRGALSEEARQKISKALRGRSYPWKKGIPLSEETKAKIRAARKFQIITDEARHKMSLARKGKPLGPFSAEHREHLRQGKLGKLASAETKMKMSATRMGKKHSPETREKMQQSATRRWKNPESRVIWETAIKNGNRWR